MAVLTFDSLMARPDIGNLSDIDALECIGALIDLSTGPFCEPGTAHALKWSDELEARKPANELSVILDYFRANAWANKAELYRKDVARAWEWQQPETGWQILYLRRALNNSSFDELNTIRRCQILTNLGNQLNKIGRFVEALEYWTQALGISKNFWMAQGNRGKALLHYGKALYNRGHGLAFVLAAHSDLTASLYNAAQYMELGYPEAVEAFAADRLHIESGIDVKAITAAIEPHEHSLGEAKAEQHYRQWCLSNRLFLNPLNDLGTHSVAATDALTLPDFVSPIDKPPALIGFFNQLKQEFVSARWLYYEGVHSPNVHFSDRDVLLYNTLDYPAYGLAIEKTKIALRMAYSLFDKIAFFLNTYMALNINPKRVFFRTIWHVSDKRPFVVRPEFEKSENWPFRGLYWLSKDLLEEEYQESTEPDARELYEIRNHLEHKYLKVHQMMVNKPEDGSPLAWLVDDLAYPIGHAEFDAKTLRVLKLARASLMYLSLGMHREEKRRATQRDKSLIAPMPLSPWEDEWKIRL